MSSFFVIFLVFSKIFTILSPSEKIGQPLCDKMPHCLKKKGIKNKKLVNYLDVSEISCNFAIEMVA